MCVCSCLCACIFACVDVERECVYAFTHAKCKGQRLVGIALACSLPYIFIFKDLHAFNYV